MVDERHLARKFVILGLVTFLTPKFVPILHFHSLPDLQIFGIDSAPDSVAVTRVSYEL
jgi:hypothetical protein